MPRVTVLIVAHNDEPFLGAAIDPVLAQTYRDFDLLVVDDASTDGSRAIVAAYRDSRVRLLVNRENLGGGGARNRGLAAISSEYVVQLDGNDLSFPQRLERQVRYLDDHPDVAVVGSRAIIIDVAGRKRGELWRPVTELGIRWCRMFQSPVINSSAAFRRAVVWDELGGYEERYRYGEDFGLWNRVAKAHVIHNLAEPLVAYRDVPGSLSTAIAYPAREGYLGRKAPMIVENVRETLQCDDVSLPAVECWLSLDDVRQAVAMIERCAARFAAVHGENEEVVRHQAWMLTRVLRKAPALRLWAKVLRRHRATALRALPRFAATFVFGEMPLRLHRRWRAGVLARSRRT